MGALQQERLRPWAPSIQIRIIRRHNRGRSSVRSAKIASKR